VEPAPQGQRVAADLETGQYQPYQAAQGTPLAERLGSPAVGAVAAAASAIALRLHPRTWDHSHFQQFKGQGSLTLCWTCISVYSKFLLDVSCTRYYTPLTALPRTKRTIFAPKYGGSSHQFAVKTCSQDLQIITNSHQAVYLRGPEGASGPRCCEPGFGGAPVGQRPGHWAVVAAQAGPLRPGRPAAVQLLGSADSVLQHYRPAREVELRKAEQGLVLGVPCLPAKILTLSTATYCLHLMKETGRMRPLNAARQTYSPPAQTANLSQRSFCCRLSLQNSVLHLGSRSKNGHTCRALSSALALGCSDICEGGAAAGVTAAATSPWPEVSTACGASGEEGTAALAEPFSRATGTAGSDAGGTGMLPGALAGSGDAVFPQQIQQWSCRQSDSSQDALPHLSAWHC